MHLPRRYPLKSHHTSTFMAVSLSCLHAWRLIPVIPHGHTNFIFIHRLIHQRLQNQICSNHTTENMETGQWTHEQANGHLLSSVFSLLAASVVSLALCLVVSLAQVVAELEFSDAFSWSPWPRSEGMARKATNVVQPVGRRQEAPPYNLERPALAAAAPAASAPGSPSPWARVPQAWGTCNSSVASAPRSQPPPGAVGTTTTVVCPPRVSHRRRTLMPAAAVPKETGKNGEQARGGRQRNGEPPIGRRRRQNLKISSGDLRLGEITRARRQK